MGSSTHATTHALRTLLTCHCHCASVSSIRPVKRNGYLHGSTKIERRYIEDGLVDINIPKHPGAAQVAVLETENGSVEPQPLLHFVNTKDELLALISVNPSPRSRHRRYQY